MLGTDSSKFETVTEKALSSWRISLIMSDVILCAIVDSGECLEYVHPNCRYL